MNKIIVAGDKTRNHWGVEYDEYNRLLKNNITQEYKKCRIDEVNKVTKEDKKMAEKFKIDNRQIFQTIPREAFQTFKDHKTTFATNKQSRLLNPCKPELGKVSKQIVEKIVKIIRQKTGFLQWKNSLSVLQWFQMIKNKSECTFIQ